MKKDIILDMVEGLGKNIGKALAKVKEEPETTEIQNFSDKEVLVLLLRKLISDKKYNEAEDMLFEYAAGHKEDEELLEIGEMFYDQLSMLTDEKLIENNFSREEITQGLKDFKNSIKCL